MIVCAIFVKSIKFRQKGESEEVNHGRLQKAYKILKAHIQSNHEDEKRKSESDCLDHLQEAVQFRRRAAERLMAPLRESVKRAAIIFQSGS